jgi:hypothetical protein
MRVIDRARAVENLTDVSDEDDLLLKVLLPKGVGL